MPDNEYPGEVIEKEPLGIMVPTALNSSTFIVNVPSTESPGGSSGPVSTYPSFQEMRNVIMLAVPVALFAPEQLHNASIL